MGSVHLAHHVTTREPAAVKRIHAKYAGQSQTLRRFAIEVQTAARLRHPNIVSVVESGTEPRGTPYCVMEWVSGRPLEAWIGMRLPWSQLCWIVGDLLDALAYAHARGVVHRDLKPANLLIEDPHSATPRMRLVDFGIARLLEDDDAESEATQLTMDDRVLGTPAYLSPEQATGQQHLVGPATDLYTFGVMLYELVSGRLPFFGLPVVQLLMAHATKKPAPIDLTRRDDVPNTLAETLERLLDKVPDQRPQSAREVREALKLPNEIPRRALPAPHGESAEEHASYTDTVGGVRADVDQAEIDTLPPVDEAGNGAAYDVAIDVQPGAFEAAELVGRREELHRIIHAARQARREDRSRLLLIQGEAGMGKSRLAQEVRYALEERIGFRGAKLHVRGGSGPDSVRTLLARLLMAERLEGKRLEGRLLEASKRYALNELDARALTAWFVEDDDQEVDQEQVRVLARVIGRIAAERPLALVVEGLDGEVGREIDALLQQILWAEVDGVVVVLAPSRRPADRLASPLSRLYDELQSEGRAETHTLGPLTDAAVIDLIQPLVPGNAEAIARRARGNPLFAIELARYRPSREALTTQSTLPVSIAEIWQKRIDGGMRDAESPGLARSALFAAATLGPSVQRKRLVELLAEGLGESVEAAEQAVDHWIRARVLADDGARQPVVSFVHTLGFEYVTDHLAVDHPLVQRLLNYLADWIVRHRVGADAGLLNRIASLLEGIGEGARAAEVRLLQGELSVGQLEYDLAESIFVKLGAAASDRGDRSMAMRVAAQLANLQVLRHDTDGAARTLAAYTQEMTDVEPKTLSPNEARTRVGLFQAEANRLVLENQGDEAVRRLYEAVELARRTEDRLALASVRTHLTQLLERAGEMADAERQCRLAIRALERGEAPERMRARAYISLASLCRRQGRTAEAREAVDTGRPLAEAAGDRLQLDRALRVLVGLADDSGDADRAVSLAEDVLARQRTFDDDVGVAHTTNLLGVLERHRGNLGQARSHHEHAMALLERLNDRPLLAANTENLGIVARRVGQAPKAIEYFTRAGELYEDLKDPVSAARIGSHMALVLRHEGDLQRAEGLAREAQRMQLELMDVAGAAHAQLVLGLVAAKLESWSIARELFTEARPVLADMGVYRDLILTETWLTLADARLGYGRAAMESQRLEERLRARPVFKRALSEGLLGLAAVLSGEDQELAWRLEDRARHIENALQRS